MQKLGPQLISTACHIYTADLEDKINVNEKLPHVEEDKMLKFHIIVDMYIEREKKITFITDNPSWCWYQNVWRKKKEEKKYCDGQIKTSIKIKIKSRVIKTSVVLLCQTFFQGPVLQR